MDDTGQFNYHLDKLVPHFVEKTADGYTLTYAGSRIVRAVIAGSAFERPTIEPTAVDTTCPFCRGQVGMSYEGGRTYAYCTECTAYSAAPESDHAEGRLGAEQFPPAGLEDRTPDEVLEATMVHMLTRIESMLADVCPDCGGSLDLSVETCDSHDATDGVCGSCHRPTLGWIRWTCTVCKTVSGGPAWIPLLFHPTVVSFLSKQGIEYHDDPWRMKDIGIELDVTEELVSEHPLRLRFGIAPNENELAVVIDGDLTVTETTRPS